MNKMKKFRQTAFAIAAAALLLPAHAMAASSVWKVSKGNDHLYLGGTVHILPASEFPLPAEFEQAYQQADTLVLEAEMPDPTDQKAAMAMMQQLSYGAGEKLSKKLSPELFKQLDAYLQGFGVSAAQLDGFKPGFIAVQMTMLEMHKAKMTGEGVDAYFAKKAVTDKKPQQYLETLEFQLALMANLGTGEEEKFVRLMLEHSPELVKVMQQSIAGWRAGDLSILDKLLLQDSRIEDPVTYQQMFTQRNQDWIPKIAAMFGNQQRELVLVGAGHLPGDDGVLQLLKAAGYTVEQI